MLEVLNPHCGFQLPAFSFLNMARYVLECPACDARFELKKYAPDKRVHCRKCRAVVIIPAENGAASVPARPIDPRIQQKLARFFSLKKLALVSGLLALALAGGSYILWQKSRTRLDPPAKPPEKVTLESLAKMNPGLAFPLGRGFVWEYELSGGVTETRRVPEMAAGLETDEPEGDLILTGARQTFRVSHDGVYLLSETRSGGKLTLSKPLLWAPYPMYSDSRWDYEGDAQRHGAPPEKWRLSFQVQGLDAIDWGAGRKLCFRLHIEGDKGGMKVDELLWYANGTGLVKRASRVDGRTEEARLVRFTKR